MTNNKKKQTIKEYNALRECLKKTEDEKMDFYRQLRKEKEENKRLEKHNRYLVMRVEEAHWEFKNYKEIIGKDNEMVFHSMYEKLEEWDIMEDTTPKFMEMWRIVIKEIELTRCDEAHLKEEIEELKEELEKIKELDCGGEIIA